ncbi:hypothetical protein PWEIH_14971, partial [Listeria weihenstephanensis FSL R9-0317]|uniref:hypothetical protein n=1 Tax=Listeria weihenstephanensis TaxID=1006155 RepID=UPI0003E89734
EKMKNYTQKKSTEKIGLPGIIYDFCELNNIGVKSLTSYANPSEEWYFTMGKYRDNSFEVEYNSILTVSKLADVYSLEHNFKVVNQDPKKIAPVLVGESEDAYNLIQFDLEELIKRAYDANNFSRMFWVDSLRKIEGITFSDDVILFGPDVTQEDILFRDVLDILPD